LRQIKICVKLKFATNKYVCQTQFNLKEIGCDFLEINIKPSQN